MTPSVEISDLGYRCGGTHHRSTVPDEIVRLLRRLHDVDGIGWRRLARRFPDLSMWTIKRIVAGGSRTLAPAEMRRVAEDGGPGRVR